MTLSMLLLILGGIAVGGIVLLLWMVSTVLFRFFGFLCGFRGRGPVSTAVRAILLIVILMAVGRLMAARWDAMAMTARECSVRQASRVPAAEFHPLQRSCEAFRTLASVERTGVKAYRRRIAERLATETDPADRKLLESEVRAVSDWLAWLEAAEELPLAVSAAVDAGTAHAAAERTGRVEYLDAASRLDVDLEKARRRTLLVLDRLTSRWADGQVSGGVDIAWETKIAGYGSGGEEWSP